MHDGRVAFTNVSYAIHTGPYTPPRPLLRDVSLTLEPGTVTALLGRSGSGKTTLMRMVNAMAMPTSGTVTVGAQTTAAWNLLDLRRGIGYVIQETGLFPHWTVARNAALALELTGTPEPERTARVAEVLALAGIDPSLSTRFPWQLSGGQRQRVGLARALAADPGILLMDEPFGALDPMTRAEMQRMFKGLLVRVGTQISTQDTLARKTVLPARKPVLPARKTVLLVTHDLDEALYLATRILFLETGEIVADLPASDVLASANPHVQRYVAAVHREDASA